MSVLSLNDASMFAFCSRPLVRWLCCITIPVVLLAVILSSTPWVPLVPKAHSARVTATNSHKPPAPQRTKWKMTRPLASSRVLPCTVERNDSDDARSGDPVLAISRTEQPSQTRTIDVPTPPPRA